jgi:hypothetical protein
MPGELSQHKIFEKRFFKFTEIGLFVHSKTFFKTHEYELKYEDIGTKLIYIKKGLKAWLIPTCILIFLSLILLIDRLNGGDVEKGAEIFYLIPGLGCLIGYLLTYEKSCYLVKPNNKNAIKFLIDKPSKEQLSDFLKELDKNRKHYLLAKYGDLNRNLTYEHQYNNLTWLRDNDVLSSDEFQEKKAKLDEYLPITTVVSGFRLSTKDISSSNY